MKDRDTLSFEGEVFAVIKWRKPNPDESYIECVEVPYGISERARGKLLELLEHARKHGDHFPVRVLPEGVK